MSSYIEHDGITHETDTTSAFHNIACDWSAFAVVPDKADGPREFGMRYTGGKQAKARARKAKQRRK